MCIITKVVARQVFDSRGNPTIEAEIYTKNFSASAICPSGASTGTYEAYEKRDKKNKKYLGKSVLKPVAYINKVISKKLDISCFAKPFFRPIRDLLVAIPINHSSAFNSFKRSTTPVYNGSFCNPNLPCSAYQDLYASDICSGVTLYPGGIYSSSAIASGFPIFSLTFWGLGSGKPHILKAAIAPSTIIIAESTIVPS